MAKFKYWKLIDGDNIYLLRTDMYGVPVYNYASQWDFNKKSWILSRYTELNLYSFELLKNPTKNDFEKYCEKIKFGQFITLKRNIFNKQAHRNTYSKILKMFVQFDDVLGKIGDRLDIINYLQLEDLHDSMEDTLKFSKYLLKELKNEHNRYKSKK